MPELKGRLGYWLKLAENAVFRNAIDTYCGHKNSIESGILAGGTTWFKNHYWWQKPRIGFLDTGSPEGIGIWRIIRLCGGVFIMEL